MGCQYMHIANFSGQGDHFHSLNANGHNSLFKIRQDERERACNDQFFGEVKPQALKGVVAGKRRFFNIDIAQKGRGSSDPRQDFWSI